MSLSDFLFLKKVYIKKKKLTPSMMGCRRLNYCKLGYNVSTPPRLAYPIRDCHVLKSSGLLELDKHSEMWCGGLWLVWVWGDFSCCNRGWKLCFLNYKIIERPKKRGGFGNDGEVVRDWHEAYVSGELSAWWDLLDGRRFSFDILEAAWARPNCRHGLSFLYTNLGVTLNSPIPICRPIFGLNSKGKLSLIHRF